MIVMLAGGVGGSKFLKGLVLTSHEEIVAVVNTGDDIERFGLYISPDIDINMYTLANVIHPQGWGISNETYACQDILSGIYNQNCWFNLGDKDLATHILRTYWLKQNKTLTEITHHFCRQWDIPICITPMSDDRIATYIETPEGRFHFQEYLIARRMTDKVLRIDLEGIQQAKPAPGVLEAIEKATLILIAPSNPLVSIGPILSVPGIKEAILQSQAKVIAVSPIVGGNVIKGPAVQMFKDLGMDVSPLGIAEYYENLLDAMVIDQQDDHYAEEFERRGLPVLVTDTIMDSDTKKRELAATVLEFAKSRLL